MRLRIYLYRFWYNTCRVDPVLFARFVETVNPDRVIRGSDEPFDTADDDRSIPPARQALPTVRPDFTAIRRAYYASAARLPCFMPGGGITQIK